MFSPIEFRPKDEDIELMHHHFNPNNSEVEDLPIKMRNKESGLEKFAPSWGWLNILSPYLTPGGKPVALILAVGLSAITISLVTGWSQIILSLSVLVAVFSE